MGTGTAANPQAGPRPGSVCSAKMPQTGSAETWQLPFGYGALLVFAYFFHILHFLFISFFLLSD